MPGAEADEPLHLGLVRPVNWAEVEVQTVLDSLSFRNGHEDDRWGSGPLSHLLGEIGGLSLPGGYLDLPVFGAYDVVAKRGGPEHRKLRWISCINDNLSEPASHDFSLLRSFIERARIVIL